MPEVKFNCQNPECGSVITLQRPAHTVKRTVECPRCGHVMRLRVRGYEELEPEAAEPEEESPAEEIPRTRVLTASVKGLPLQGQLTLLRRGWLNKTYPLPEGSHLVGRADEAQPSDISISGDTSMSRRSVRIDVTSSLDGYFFRLTVIRAANPVRHNGNRLAEGESVSLNFGDILEMGHTRFRFDKATKSKPWK